MLIFGEEERGFGIILSRWGADPALASAGKLTRWR